MPSLHRHIATPDCGAAAVQGSGREAAVLAAAGATAAEKLSGDERIAVAEAAMVGTCDADDWMGINRGAGQVEPLPLIKYGA